MASMSLPFCSSLLRVSSVYARDIYSSARGVGAGHVELDNLVVRRDALRAFDLPLDVEGE